MTDPTIICPNCKTEIKLTESLAAPLLESTRRQYEQRIADKDAELAEKLLAERAAMAVEETKKAKLLLGADLDQKTKELTELQEVLKERDGKLAEAQNAQADLIRKQRELDDAKREMELTIEKRIQESLQTTRDKAKKEAEDDMKLKVAEREQTILAMQKQIEDLKRRAEQGSQQLQGDVQELELESLLKESFPRDSVEPVPTGEHGGDVLQRVIGPMEQMCGTILWESKRTKNWSDGWLVKLRDDQRAAKAECAIIVSQVLPKEVDVFDYVDGIWITCRRTVIPVCIALRTSLIELAQARKASDGQQTKTEMVYHYLTGPGFRTESSGDCRGFFGNAGRPKQREEGNHEAVGKA